MQVIETDRLLLRKLEIDDNINFYQLNLDPEVIRYTGDQPFKNPATARTFLKNYDHYLKYGYGRWAVILKTDQDFLGWCGLKFSPDLKETDIGFRFFKKHWNKGYATEAAKASIALGFNTYHLDTIVGRAMKKNIASVQVLKKTGMMYNRDADFDNHEGVVYEIQQSAAKSSSLLLSDELL